MSSLYQKKKPATLSVFSLTPSPRDHKVLFEPAFSKLIPVSQLPTPVALTQNISPEQGHGKGKDRGITLSKNPEWEQKLGNTIAT